MVELQVPLQFPIPVEAEVNGHPHGEHQKRDHACQTQILDRQKVYKTVELPAIYSGSSYICTHNGGKTSSPEGAILYNGIQLWKNVPEESHVAAEDDQWDDDGKVG